MFCNGPDLPGRCRHVDDGNTRQMRLHYILHLGIRADLHQFGKLQLDLSERHRGRNLDNKAGIAEQASVGDVGDECILAHFGQFEADRPPDIQTEQSLDCIEQRIKDVRKLSWSYLGKLGTSRDPEKVDNSPARRSNSTYSVSGWV